MAFVRDHWRQSGRKGLFSTGWLDMRPTVWRAATVGGALAQRVVVANTIGYTSREILHLEKPTHKQLPVIFYWEQFSPESIGLLRAFSWDPTSLRNSLLREAFPGAMS
jgi:hypothetical protein